MPTDKRLARRASEGDERAFAAIFRRYQQDLYRYCLAIVSSPEDAQDALQNTMVSALRALPGESREIELKPWLYRIAHNQSIDLVRRRRAGEPLDPELTAAGPGLPREAEVRERLGRLLADLEELPERQRGALLMRELSGLGFDEIGAALGCSPAVARQTIYEARLGLRQFEAGREMDCVAVTKALSDADGRVARRRDIRAHLRDCPSCAAFQAEIGGRRRDLAALSPLPALLGAGLLKGALGGGAAGGGGLASSAALKATATVAVVAALGVGAERGQLIDVGLPKAGGGTSAAPARTPSAAAAAAAAELDGDAAATKTSAERQTAGDRREIRKVTIATAAAVLDREARTAGKPEAAAPGITAAPASDGGAAAPDRGHGPKPELPATAGKGQENAAARQDNADGRGGAQPARPEHAGRPEKPVQAVRPEKPEVAQGPAATGGNGRGDASPPAETPVPGTGNGKKPAA